MSKAVFEILSRIDSHSQQERARSRLRLHLLLEPGEEPGVDEAWHAELSRRVAEIRSGQATGKPADQLFSELRAPRL